MCNQVNNTTQIYKNHYPKYLGFIQFEYSKLNILRLQEIEISLQFEAKYFHLIRFI